MELDTTYRPETTEEALYRRWLERGDFRASEETDREPFSIVIPPPNVTGVLHMGHALNNTYQDIMTRWRRMQGREACWIPGTDHAGIATQNVVERKLAEEGRTRQELGREKFLERVWEWKEEHGRTIIDQLKRLGASCDWDRERFTMDPGLSRAVREAFVTLHERDLIYRGHYLVNWCPRCRTALSDEEAIDEEIDGGLWHIRYPLADGSGHLTVATTRPETMLGDTGVAVNPEDERYADLIGKDAILPFINRPLPIIADPHVDTEFGTGCLKVTPAHDAHDFEIGQRHGIPVINVLDEEGRINERGGSYEGLDRFEARDRIVHDLEAKGLLADHEEHRHAVPHCQRCDTILEPYLSTQWFVDMEPLAEPAIECVEEGEVRFHPERWTKTYMSWMKEIRDWCISRQLWWGHRIPAWYCKDCDAEHRVEGATVGAGGEEWNYRYQVDAEPIIARTEPDACPRCGGTTLEQDPDVLDTWFSSWLWPFSTMGWPEETETLETFYPTDVLVTAPDIIFFWVARMIMAGFAFTGEAPFPDIYIHGLVQDEHGAKMSKSTGNVIDPVEMMERHSADALRFSLIMLTSEGQDCQLSEERIKQGRNFCNKLWNAARLVLQNLDDYPGTTAHHEVLESLDDGPLEDRWILSRLHRTVEDLNGNLETFRFHDALDGVYHFVWHTFCDWYLERVKPRLYGNEPDREAAQVVLAEVLDTVCRLLHPFVPFVTEAIWRKLKEATGLPWGETLARSSFPAADASFRDPEADEAVELLQDVVREVRTIRDEYSIPPSQALDLILKVDGEPGSLLGREETFLENLARIEEVTVDPEAERPPHSSSAVVEGIELFVPLGGAIDVEAERERLEGKLEELLGHLRRSKSKLMNEDFLEKAPEEVVDRERDKRDDLKAETAKLERLIEDLE